MMDGSTLMDKKEQLTINHLNSLSIKFLKLQVIFLIINLLSKFLSCTFISLIFGKLHFYYTLCFIPLELF